MGWIKILMVHSCFSLPTCMFYCVFCYSLLHYLIISVASSNAVEWLYFLSSLSCCQRLKEETYIWFLPFVFIYIICTVWFISQWSFMVVCRNWNNLVAIIRIVMSNFAIQQSAWLLNSCSNRICTSVCVNQICAYLCICICLFVWHC